MTRLGSVMKSLYSVFRYLSEDPLRLLTIIGGSGGMAYWVGLIRNRSRVVVWLIEERLSVSGSNARPDIRFEAESFGREPTSLLRPVHLVAYTPKRVKLRFAYHIRENDRSLRAYSPKIFAADTEPDEILPLLWFKKYTFSPTRGMKRRLYIRTAAGDVISCTRYLRELVAFRLWGKVPDQAA